MRVFGQDWNWLCWCGHDWNKHLTQFDKPYNSCDECKCRDYRENRICRSLSLNWEIIVISTFFGLLAGGFSFALMMLK